MASYTKEQVANANLPVAEMIARLNPKTHPKDKSRFFNHVVRFGAAAAGKTLTEAEIDTRGSNLAYNFTRFANGVQDTLPMGLDANLTDLATAWSALSNGTLNLGNGNGNGTKTSTPAASGTETRREEEAANVPPVSQNVYASALKVFDGLRTQDGAFPIPANADDTYELLWDNLAEPVKTGRASGVISDTLVRLMTENRDLFTGIITVLPQEVKDAIEEVLIDRAYDLYKGSLKTTVEDVYHISKGRRHAAPMFSAWASQVAAIANWIGRDQPSGWSPTEDDLREASRTHAVATLRSLSDGLKVEVASSLPTPAPAPEVSPIQFNTIMGRLLSKGAEIMAEVGGRWGSMTPEQQHAFVADLDKEEAAATETAKVADAPAPTASPAQAPKAPGNRQNAPKA